MAVIQISKIQVRRGKKNSNSGVPQLSSAELAWAIDTQELFIGNGSVADGAPYVGNTKILTEHDNILDLASGYQFAYNDPSIVGAVERNLQGKLDEYVSVLDFGAVGDGSTDCVAAFELAFAQLFRNSNPNYRKVLVIPNGEYLFLSDLRIPSKTILQGETQAGAVLNLGSNNIRLITSDGKEVIEFDSTNRPTDVRLSNFTIRRTTGQLVLTGLANSDIEKVRFFGEYTLGDSVSLTNTPPAVTWTNDLFGVRVHDIKFESCMFDSVEIGIKCAQSTAFDTSIYFHNCEFQNLDTAIYIDGVAGQGNNWRIIDCEFEEIAKQAFRSTQGRGTVIHRCKLKNVGNDTNTADSPTDYMIYFGEKTNNVVIDCTANRLQNAAIVTSAGSTIFPEVYNGDKVSFLDRNTTEIFLTDSFRPLAVFSALDRYLRIDYFLMLDTYSRWGQLTITLDDDLAEAQITDKYQYSSSLANSTGGQVMTNFEFLAELRDNDADSGADTIVLSYKNPLLTGRTGNISFDVTYGV